MPDIKISGLIFDLEPRYAEGHQCTAAEANALNAQMRESVRNNFAQRIKAAREGGLDEATIREMYATYVANFSFSDKVPNRQPHNKVRQIAEEMAATMARQLLGQRGLKFEDFDKHRQAAMIERILRDRPQLLEEAQRQLDVKRQAAAAALGYDLDDEDETDDAA